jgi:hypothetical protein
MHLVSPMDGYAGKRIGNFRARTTLREGGERRTPRKSAACLVAVLAMATSALAFAYLLASRCTTTSGGTPRCICHLSIVEPERQPTYYSNYYTNSARNRPRAATHSRELGAVYLAYLCGVPASIHRQGRTATNIPPQTTNQKFAGSSPAERASKNTCKHAKARLSCDHTGV